MKWLFSFAFVAIAWGNQAWADVIRSFQVGHWSVAAYADSDGIFSHCASGMRFNSGISLLFSVNNDFVWTIAFHSKEWSFEPTQQVSLNLALDRAQPIKLTGEAFDRSGIVITLDDDADLFRKFRAAKRLKISGAKRSFDFELTRMDEMLAKLLACAKQSEGGGEAAIQNKNPFMTTKRSSAEISAEATAFAASLLSDAKIAGYRFLTPGEKPKLIGDARWALSGQGLGSISIHPDIDLDAQRTLLRQLIAQQVRSCEGKFGSGYLPDDEKGPGSAFVICDVDEMTLVFYFFAMPRVSGGAYLVTTGYFGNAAAVTEAKEQHQKFREAAFTGK